MFIAFGILYYLGLIAAERLNKDLHEFDPNFPVIGLAWIVWPLTLATFFFFHFLIPSDKKSEKLVPRFVRWYNKKQKR